MAGPTQKEINLVIQAKSLATKPIAELDAAVKKLNEAVEALAPASEKGEAKLDELRTVAGQLKDALKGLASSAGILETFERMSLWPGSMRRRRRCKRMWSRPPPPSVRKKN
jgi:uncharacterized phage infection (PIP) family protein YhgE